MATRSHAPVAVQVPRAAPHTGNRRADAAFDVERVRRDFPILGLEVRGKPLAYLDTAATSQKPSVVIDAVARFYRESNANVHRGV